MLKNMANRVPLLKSSRGDVAVLIKPQVHTLTPGDQFFWRGGTFALHSTYGCCVAAVTNRNLGFLQCEWRYRVGCSPSISMKAWASGGLFPASVLARAAWGPLLPFPSAGWSDAWFIGGCGCCSVILPVGGRSCQSLLTIPPWCMQNI